MKFKTLPIFLAFLLMGVADAMGPLSDAVKTKFQLSAVMAALMPFFVFIAFAAGVPALQNPTYLPAFQKPTR